MKTCIQEPTTAAQVSQKIPYSRQCIGQEEIAAVTAVLQSDFLTQGPAVAAFEKELSEYLGAQAVSCSNGTTALHLACAALDIDENSIGVVTPISFAASANCLRYVGAEVVFSDIDSASGHLCPKALEKTLKKLKPKSDNNVVVAVSLNGQVADLQSIQAVSKKYGFKVIEDAAHSFGGHSETFKSADCTYSDIATLSFHPLKSITTGEGGSVVTRFPEIAKRIRCLRGHGIVTNVDGKPAWYKDQVALGWNFRLCDIQAAVGSAQLKKLDNFVAARQKIAQRYRQTLSQKPFSDIFSLNPDTPGHAYHLFVLRFSQAGRRDCAYNFLKRNNIESQVHYPLISQLSDYKKQHGRKSLPNAEQYAESCLSIPIFPQMTQEQQDRVIEALLTFRKMCE
ncbi:MAG: hypothetical protein A2Y14_02855 [Verrucomicrobia bacterium GWF2_51_19]|nr:MAG: hypothetical protein A2Y14_02855 [Verrucomicrobia bacterium GWF2_51_19]HCJ11831.1 UDP-4-amino-4,6-dideoxy-N-acetyl-beta-L-altrosamine transaminase [Opitutae bacterium]